MANLSNINNVLRTNSTGVGIFDDAVSYPLEISSATTAGMRLINTAGATYDVYGNTSEEFLITKVGVGERLKIASGGAITFNNAYTFPTAVTTTNNYVLTAQTDGSTAWAADGGGTVKGTGTATRVAFWSASDTISSHADFYWDNANDRLGIGVGSAPLKKLNVQGTVRIQTNTNYYSDRTYLGDTWEFASDTTDGVTFSITGGLAATAGNYFRWLTQEGAATPTERMRITSAGDVGIGTDDPQTNLEISHADSAGLTIRSVSLTGYSLINFADAGDINVGRIYYGHDDNAMRFRTNDVERMRIDSSGDVGIGTDSPVSKLSINSNGIPIFAAAAMATTGLTVHNSTGGTAIQIGTYDAGAYNYIQSGYVNSASTARELRFYSGATQQMTLFADGDVSIGMTANHAMLNVNGNVRAENSSFLAGRETAGAPAFAFHDDADTGMFNVASNILCFSTAGTERMRIDSSGNVGINYTTPFNQISGTETTLAVSNSNAASLYLNNTAAGGHNHILFSGTGGALSFYDKDRADYNMVIDSSGNVGIGTTSPVSQANYTTLCVNGTNSALIEAQVGTVRIGGIDSSSNALYFGSIGSFPIIFRVAVVEKMRVTTGGQVGIGTPSPQDYDGESDDLVVAGGVNGTNPTPGITIACLANQAATGKGALRFADGTSGNERYRGAVEYQHSGDDMFFRTSGSIQVAIDSAGQVGIGTTDPSTLLNLEKSVDAFQALLIESTATWPVSNAAGSKFTNSSGSLYMFVDNGGGDYGPTGGTGAASAYAGNFRLTGAYPMQFATSDTLRMTITSGGDVGINDSTPSYKLDVDGTIRATGDVIAYSDIRVKENIKTIENSLDKVSKLRGVSYTRKDIDDKSTKIGVIAQEVIDVLPEVVSQDDKGKYSVAYGNISGLLIEAIKELKQEIEELKSKPCNCNNCNCNNCDCKE